MFVLKIRREKRGSSWKESKKESEEMFDEALSNTWLTTRMGEGSPLRTIDLITAENSLSLKTKI